MIISSKLIRHNTDLIGTLDEHVLDEDVRKQLLELSEELHEEKREALAVLNNKVSKLHDDLSFSNTQISKQSFSNNVPVSPSLDLLESI